jgi:hypothetical protein
MNYDVCHLHIDGDNVLASSYTRTYHNDHRFPPYAIWDVVSKEQRSAISQSLSNKSDHHTITLLP